MDDYFEHEFEDELEAMRDMEDIDSPDVQNAKSKRSLFEKATPSTPQKSSLDDSFPTELQSTPNEPEEATPKRKMSQTITPSLNETATPVPKKRRTLGRGDSDLEAQRVPEIPSAPLETSSSIRVRRRWDRDSQPPGSMESDDRAVALPPMPSRLLRRIPPGESLAITSCDGVRTGYLPIRPDGLQEATYNVTPGSSPRRELLGVDFQALKKQVENKRHSDALSNPEALEKNLTDYSRENDGETESRLWVEKYAPKLYLDLLSDETVNRVLLRWVKMWDYVVFGGQKPAKKTGPGMSAHKQHNKPGTKQTQQEKKEFFKKLYEDLGLEEEYDATYRPTQKVVLLCGRPGLGKTTLAHVITRHAGYNAIEMNASDERTATAFRERIGDCLTTRAVMGLDRRPNCLIIDEIDGAPAPAINALISMLNDSGDEGGGKKKKNSNSKVMRPIICICNDLYTPALRPLRQMALTLTFPQQCPTKLAARLQEVASAEGLRADTTSLGELCNRTGSDIRSCLNTLQFVRRQGVDLTIKKLLSMNVGSKDEQKSLFTFWQTVFTMPRQTKKTYMPNVYGENCHQHREEDTTSLTGRFSRIYRDAQACGEHTRVVQGLHENFLSMKFKDPFMRGVRMGTEWLCYADMMNKKIMTQQLFQLNSYLHYLPVVFHLKFCQASAPKIIYPRKQYEVSQKLSHMHTLLTMMTENADPSIAMNLSPTSLTLDMLPILLDYILQPNMRPVNIQLYSTREKEQLKEMVDTMIAYNLTYRQQKAADGQYIYSLEPCVDEVVHYPEMKKSGKVLSYTARQLIANEIQTEKQRRADYKCKVRQDEPTTPHGSQTPSSRQATPTATPSRRVKAIQEMVTPNHKAKLQPKKVTPSARAPTDFFGRPINRRAKLLSPESIQAKADNDLLRTDIWYKYESGYSNAVRKKVTITNLL